MTDERSRDLDLIAASLRADTQDIGAFVESLADKLEHALPDRVRVFRSRPHLLAPKRVRRIRVEAGGRRLELLAREAGVETSVAHVSGGIVLKTEEVEMDLWLAELARALAGEAERSEQAREALERRLLE